MYTSAKPEEFTRTKYGFKQAIIHTALSRNIKMLYFHPLNACYTNQAASSSIYKDTKLSK